MRPRQFNEDAVLETALTHFWRSGVRGASLVDIARDAQVQRGSLYHAYGSREALFLKAYSRYRDSYMRAIDAALSGVDLETQLRAFFAAAIANFADGDPPRGCPTTRGLMELDRYEDQTMADQARSAFAALLTDVQDRLEKAFTAGVARGDFSGDPASAARIIFTIARGMVVINDAFQNRTLLDDIANDAVNAVLARPSSIGP